MDYTVVETSYVKSVCKLPRWGMKFVAMIVGGYSLLRDMVKLRARVYGRFKEAFPHLSLIDRFYKSMQYYYYSQLVAFEYGELLYKNEQKIVKTANRLKVKGLDTVKKNTQNSQGMVLFVWHIGNMFLPLLNTELMKELSGRVVRCIAPVGSAERKRALQNRIRTEMGVDFEFMELHSEDIALTTFDVLSNNGVVICTVDWSYSTTRTKLVDFYGRKRSMPVGIVEIARITGAIGYPLCLPTVRGRKEIIIEDPIDFSNVNRGEDALQKVIEKLNSIGTGFIDRFPEQWAFWDRIPRLRM